jgi:hypothetical protein
MRFLVKPKLPAPIKAIFFILNTLPFCVPFYDKTQNSEIYYEPGCSTLPLAAVPYSAPRPAGRYP